MPGPVLYNFEIYGPRTEVLGSVALRDDAEAIEFATGTIRDLTREGDEYAGCTLLITEGARSVAILPIPVTD